MRPKLRGRASRVAASSETPSSSGTGAGQVRTSSTQVAAMPVAPISGMTAMGLPARGTTTNQGRVGLSQNWLAKPVK